ncbi:TPA: hypothetical protein ACORDH_003237, partial [Bacillus cereus]
MKNPWNGKGIWDEIYKYKNLNIQDNLHEKRGGKEEVPPELKEEDVASKLEKEGKASESQIGPLIRSLVVKTPFSIFSEVTSFKIFPKINV